MEDLDQISRYIPSGALPFLWVALAIGVLFVGIMVYDVLRRKRSDNRFKDRRPGGWRRAMARPFRRVGELRAELRELRRQRTERRKWDEPDRHRRRSKRH